MDLQVKVDVSTWKLRQYKDFLNAAKSGDLDKVVELAAQLVVEWSLPGDPHDLNSWWDGLNLKEWNEISNLVGEAIAKEFSSPKK